MCLHDLEGPTFETGATDVTPRKHAVPDLGSRNDDDF